MSTAKFSLTAVAIGVLVMAFAHWFHVDYLFFASYTILQFIVLATAWNILGGYCGYVNFGSAAFFALGAYSSVALIKFDAEIDTWFPEGTAGFLHHIFPLPIPVLIRVRRFRLRNCRIRHGISDLAAARLFLCDRDPGDWQWCCRP